MIKKINWSIDFKTTLIIGDMDVFLKKWIINNKDLETNNNYRILITKSDNINIKIWNISIDQKIINKSWKIIIFQEDFTESYFYYLYDIGMTRDLQKRYPNDYKKALEQRIDKKDIIYINSKIITSDTSYKYILTLK